jgi:hypothetical protein
MIIKIFLEQRFATLNSPEASESLAINDNNSIIYNFTSLNRATNHRYENLDELLQDTKLSDTIKWLARGMVGMPLGIKKAPVETGAEE